MSTRRSFVRRLLGVATLGLMPAVATPAPREKLLVYDVVHDPDHYVAAVWDLPPETPRVYFNGEDWTNRVCECHTREGWVIAFDVEPSSSPWGTPWKIVHPSVRRKHFGKVELRAAPDAPAQACKCKPDSTVYGCPKHWPRLA
jgi:hypothetical protein